MEKLIFWTITIKLNTNMYDNNFILKKVLMVFYIQSDYRMPSQLALFFMNCERN